MRLLASVLLLACGACAEEAPGNSEPDTSGSPPSQDALADAAGCTRVGEGFEELLAEDTPQATVRRVQWVSTAAGASWLAWLTPEGRLQTADSPDTDGKHSVLALGLVANTTTPAVAVVETPEGRLCSDPILLSTGPLDPALPALTVEADDASLLQGGFVLVPVMDAGGSWLVVLDDQARIVWWWRLDTDWAPETTPAFRMELAPDGSGLIVNTQGERLLDDGFFTHVTWDGTATRMLAVLGAHTDWTYLPDGSLLTLKWVARDFEGGRRLLGDQLIEVPADGGEPRVIWDAFEAFAPDLGRSYPLNYLQGDPEIEDWTHANGIAHDAENDAVLVSLPGLEAVLSVDRTTGAPNWVLSSEVEGLAQDGDEPLIEQPHSVEATSDGGLLVFNRGDWVNGTSCSRAVEIDLDLDARTAVAASTYTGPECESVAFLGNAEHLPGGGTLVTFSSSGLIDVVDTSGATAWRVRTSLGAGLGFATHVAALP